MAIENTFSPNHSGKTIAIIYGFVSPRQITSHMPAIQSLLCLNL